MAITRYKTKNQQSGQLVIDTHSSIHFIRIERIKYLKASSNYTQVFTCDGRTILASKTLGYFESILDERYFLRIHNSYLINAFRLCELKKNGSLKAIMDDGQVIPVSTNYRSQTIKTLLHN